MYVHYVLYDTSCYRAEMPECLAAMFSRKFCTFGFATHLFQEDIRNMEGRWGPTNILDSVGRLANIPESVRGQPNISDSAGAHFSTLDPAKGQQNNQVPVRRLPNIPDSVRCQPSILNSARDKAAFQESARSQFNLLDSTRGQPSTSASASGQRSIVDKAGLPFNSVKGPGFSPDSALLIKSSTSNCPHTSTNKIDGGQYILHLLLPSNSHKNQFNRCHLKEQIRELDILEGINIR